MKINPNKEWSFYETHHNPSYILRHDCSKNVPLREPRENRTYRLINNSEKEIVVYKIDGGIINNDRVAKCDYGIYTEDDLLILIELKGSDLDHAIEQITSTIYILLKRKNIKVRKMNVRIVLSRVCKVPNIISTKEKILKQLLHKSYGCGDYKKQSRELEDRI